MAFFLDVGGGAWSGGGGARVVHIRFGSLAFAQGHARVFGLVVAGRTWFKSFFSDRRFFMFGLLTLWVG